MERHHDDALVRRIEEVTWTGISEIKWWELKAWYKKDRIGKTVWRDLNFRFEEATDNAGDELYVYESDDGVTLVHSDGLKKISEKIGEAE